MSGLFSALNNSASSLAVYSRALEAEQQNVGNVSTPGYAAQRVRISNTIALPGNNATDSISISSASDIYADALVRQSSADTGQANSQVQVLTGINQLFDITGKSGILSAFEQFSSAFSQLSVNPDDASLRSAAISSGQQVANAFHQAANSLDQTRTQVESEITSTVQQINTLTSRIAYLNGQTHLGAQVDAPLRQALDDLSNLVDVNVTSNSDGSVTVLAGGQVPLVADDRSFAVSATGLGGSAGGGLGQVQMQSSNGIATSNFSGKLGGLLSVRNNVLPGLLGGGGQPGAINQLASTFATQVNSVLTAAQTSSGTGAVAGSALFTFDTTDPTDAARSLQAVSLTPAQLGVSTVSSGGTSNGAALALAGLTTSNAAANQINGLSMQDFYSQTASGVGQQLSTQTLNWQQLQSALTTYQNNRQQAIGVSLDQEAISITSYQRAFQAAAQVVSTLNTLTQTEVDLIK